MENTTRESIPIFDTDIKDRIAEKLVKRIVSQVWYAMPGNDRRNENRKDK